MGVRVPRITLKADYGEESSFGELSMLSIGYGLHQAWVYATMFGTSSLFGIQPIANSQATAISLPFMISIAVFSLCLLFAAVTNQKFLRFYVSKKVMGAAAVLMCAGTAILLIPSITGSSFFVLEALSGIATGIGSALLILFWGTAFSRCDSASIVLNTAIAIAFGIGIYALVLQHVPFPLAGLLTAALPLFELIILRKKTPEPYSERNEIPIFNPLPVKQGIFVLKFGIPVLIFGFALGTLRQTSIQTVMPAATANDQLLVLLAAGFATILILITVLALGGPGRWNKYFRPLIPFIAVSVFFLPFFASGNVMIGTFFLVVGYMCFEALMWIFFGELSQKYRLSPVFVFGIGRGLLSMAALVGATISLGIASQYGTLPFGEANTALVLMLVMVIAYALLPGEREIEAIVIPCPLARAVHQGAFDEPRDESNAACYGHIENNADLALGSNGEAPDSPNGIGAEQLDQPRSGRFRAQCEGIANQYLLSRRETEVLFLLAKGRNSAYIQEKLFLTV